MPQPAKKPSFLGRILPKRFRRDYPVVPVVRLSGTIGTGSTFRPGLSLNSCASTLEKAFSYSRASAIAIAINSPGGSPVQSNLIFRRIRALAEEKEVPVYTFCEDVAASGGYWLACAGDRIYADPNSIVGSIGVVAAGFGFDQAIAKLGIERRVYTAGDRKVILDPFQPEKPRDVKQLKAIQNEMHESFKALVAERRGKALNGDHKALFSGEFWTGATAKELGLVDDLGDMRSVLREMFGDKVQLKLVSGDRGRLFRRIGLGKVPALEGLLAAGDGYSLTGDALETLESRALWARYGL